MKIDQAVLDKRGRTLIARGALLDDYMIEALMNRGVTGVYTVEGEADEPEVQEEEKIPEKTLEKIEKLKVEDRAKVQLTESVKQRVAQGVSYLYTNTESEDFILATNAITGDLMKAITENDSIAFDIHALKVSDEYTFKHSVDVATMAMIIAKQYGLSEKEIYEIGIAGLLHDIGKTQIPSEILNKAGRLTEEEFGIMKKHALFGYTILKEKSEISNPVLMGVLQHHEKLNGQGYPMGVPEEKIFTYAKIISMADIYDALVTERSYKKAFSPRDAVEMIMAMTDELDIEVMRSFLNSVILYPVGTTVKLSNGEKAKVVENNPKWILRPKVVGLKTGRVYDLAEDLACASIVIE
ncbi:MAG: HD-GYP domain-containing protein [Lachnospiraceae bacterium]|nr:HD-GYP domain-containing protein [Lachnospiraceae bacterium]